MTTTKIKNTCKGWWENSSSSTIKISNSLMERLVIYISEEFILKKII